MTKMILAATLMSVSLFAADYTQMTTEELNAMRGTVAVEDRDAFRAEMQSRMQAMTAEEREAFIAQRQASGQGRGQGQGQHLRDGSGAGQMKRGGQGMGGRNK